MTVLICRTKSEELQAVWAELEMDAAHKGRKLWEANEQQQFYRAVKDVDLWLDEVEKQLASEDLGKVSHNKKNLHCYQATIIKFVEILNSYSLTVQNKQS